MKECALLVKHLFTTSDSPRTGGKNIGLKNKAMENNIKISEDIYWVGASDRSITLFENVLPIHRGVSYNNYLVLDEKTTLFDTADHAVGRQFFENIAAALNGRRLDYVVVQHMEPDHCATLEELLVRYPEVIIVTNSKAVQMITQFFELDLVDRVQLVAEGDTLTTGRHTFTFVMAPMVHWPEVMLTYDSTDHLLFSADAFGTFGALNGNIFADEVNYTTEWVDDMRRYYTNIVGKYGVQVQATLKKAQSLDIRTICPLHGPIIRTAGDIDFILDKYSKWSAYEPEEKGVMIAYGSMYGDTEAAMNKMAALLAARGVKHIAMYDVARTDETLLVAEAFRWSHIVLAAPTYTNGLYGPMEHFLNDLKSHNLQNRSWCIIENGSWAPVSGKLMRAIVEPLKGSRFVNTALEARQNEAGQTLTVDMTLKSSMKASQLPQMEQLVDAIAVEVAGQQKEEVAMGNVDPKTIFRISYGLYVLTAREGDKDNGCIINTAVQLTSTPLQIMISVNKSNLTHDMVLSTGKFNLSLLTEQTPMNVIQHFGFQSGRTVNKFADCESEHRSVNGLLYVPKYTNAFISAHVIKTVDVGTHTIFIAEVTEAQMLSDERSLTYAYYQENIKPKVAATAGKTKWVCKVCGYVYEGDELPDDFICPWCKHGKEDFEKVTG